MPSEESQEAVATTPSAEPSLASNCADRQPSSADEGALSSVSDVPSPAPSNPVHPVQEASAEGEPDVSGVDKAPDSEAPPPKDPLKEVEEYLQTTPSNLDTEAPQTQEEGSTPHTDGDTGQKDDVDGDDPADLQELQGEFLLGEDGNLTFVASNNTPNTADLLAERFLFRPDPIASPLKELLNQPRKQELEFEKPAFSIHGVTDTGKHREHNEDDWVGLEEHRFVAIADGMGGHQCGEVASHITIESLTQSFSHNPPDHWYAHLLPWLTPARLGQRRLKNAIRQANREVWTKSQSDAQYRGMGTTVVALWLDGSRLHVAHVGDSRIYLYRDETLYALTRDHSLLNQYIDQGMLTPEEIRVFPMKNVIVRAIGLLPKVNVECVTIRPHKGDRYLLCSDGLTDMVDEEHIVSILKQTCPPSEIVLKLRDAALDAGGCDNITAVIADITPGEP